MKKYFIYIVVFIAGFVVMTYEIVASRILAPYIGTSIIAWTSIIGVILGSLSIGYYWGGKIADKGATNRGLGNILLTAGLWTLGLYYFKDGLLDYVYSHINDLRALSLLMSFYAFSFPNVLFGMVSPYSIKILLKNIKSTGEISGRIFALSTMGSIAGTFITGFYLISFIGSSRILMIIAIMAIIGAVLMYMSSKNTHIILVLSILLTTLIIPKCYDGQNNRFGIFEKDTLYNKAIVIKQEERYTGRAVLRLENGCISCSDGSQSLMYADTDNDLAAEYTKYFRMGSFLKPGISSVLMLGGGAYSYPKEFVKTNKDATIDVVEIDEGITKIAREFFNLENSPQMNIIHQGARNYLNHNQKKYDAVYLDIFSSDSSSPFQTSSIEFMNKVNESLASEGLVIMNITSSVLGEKGRFFRSELKTMKEVFPSVYFFSLRTDNDEYANGNIILLAFKEETDVSVLKTSIPDYYLNHLYTKSVSFDMPVLTDDFAPVEYYAVQRIANKVNNGGN